MELNQLFAGEALVDRVDGYGYNLPDSDVEYVAADAAGDGHVTESFPGHDNAGDKVGDAGAGRQEGQPRHLPG